MRKITQSLQLRISLLITLLFVTFSMAQVGIGTTNPDGSSSLDIVSTDSGILIPRMTQAQRNAITSPVEGLLIYQTSGTAGFYYYTGIAWVPISAGSNGWALTGNATVSTDFLGTTNAQDIDVRTTNIERMRVQADGLITAGFGANVGNADQQFQSVGVATNGDGVAGYSGGTGIGVYGQNIAGGFGAVGLNISSGVGVFGFNNSTGDAIAAEHDGSGDGVNSVNFGTGYGVYAENFFGTNFSLYALDGSASVYGENQIGGEAVVGETTDNISNGIWGINNDPDGTGVLGGYDGIYVYPSAGSGVSGSGNEIGLYGYAGLGANDATNYGNSAGQFELDTDANPATNAGNNGARAQAIIAGFDDISPDGSLTAQTSYFGGYFLGGNINSTPSFAYAGIKYNASNNGTMGTNYKIIGNGTNSTIIKDEQGTPRILFSPEAPEILFEDYGTGNLVNGIARIDLDPILRNAIHVDEERPLKVFIQLEGDCNGVYVTEKSQNGFTVKELANGTSNVPFSWHIVANRADDINEMGEITSRHVGLRFPVGPGPAKFTKSGQKKEKDLKVNDSQANNKQRNARIDDRKSRTEEPYSEQQLKKISKKIITENNKE